MSRFKVKQLRLAHWIVTLLFLGLQAWAARQFLGNSPRMTDAIIGLGYPTYLVKMLGIATLLGIFAIATNLSHVLKEWAYAGFAFEACGAVASHLGSGDSPLTLVVPAGVLVLGLASYTLWKRSLRSAMRRRRQRFALYEPGALDGLRLSRASDRIASSAVPRRATI